MSKTGMLVSYFSRVRTPLVQEKSANSINGYPMGVLVLIIES